MGQVEIISDYVHALGKLDFSEADNPWPTSVWSPESAADDNLVKGLDSLALILQFGRGERVATALCQREATLHILWAKDGVQTGEELKEAQQYINKVVGKCNFNDLREAQQTVIEACTRSIVDCCAYFRKGEGKSIACKAPPLGHEKWRPWWRRQLGSFQSLDKLLLKHGVIDDGEQAGAYLANFTRTCARLKRRKSHWQEYHDVLNGARQLGPLLDETYDVTSNCERALRRLYAYATAVENIAKYVSPYLTHEWTGALENVNAPFPRVFEVHERVRDTLSIPLDPDALSDSSPTPGLSPTRNEAIRGTDQNNLKRVDGPAKDAVFFQHPSLTLAIKLIRNSADYVYLGTSGQGCCSWCNKWMMYASRYVFIGSRKIHFRWSSGYYPSDWCIPIEPGSNAYSMVSSDINQSAEDIATPTKYWIPRPDLSIAEEWEWSMWDPGEDRVNHVIRSVKKCMIKEIATAVEMVDLKQAKRVVP